MEENSPLDIYKNEYLENTQSHIINSPKIYKYLGAVSKCNYFQDIPSDGNVLEFGCGLGQNIAFLKNPYGFDVSPFSLSFCKSKGITMYDAIEKIPDDFFDVILSSHCLEHLPNPFDNLILLKKKLKQDGKLIVILPFEKTPGGRFEGNPFKKDPDNHLYCWNFRNINNLLTSAGYKILENNLLKIAGYHFLSKFQFEEKTYANLANLLGSIPFISKKIEIRIVAKN